jgi:hypothetical protein
MLARGFKKFRNKPVEVEAMFFDGTNTVDLMSWLGSELCAMAPTRAVLLIATPEGSRRAEAGDWVIKDEDGAAYPLKSSIFEMKFEPAIQD